MNANTAKKIETGLEGLTLDHEVPSNLTQLELMIAALTAEVHAVRDAAERSAPDPRVPNTAAVTRRNRGATAMDATTTIPEAPGPAGNKPNTVTLESMLTDAKALGVQAGQGKDVQIKLDLKVLEAAFQGSLDTVENKHGDGVSDAVKIAEAYVMAQGSATVFDAKAANQRKTVSNVQKMIKLGGNPKWGPGEPISTVNNFMSIRQKLRADASLRGKLEDAHNALMRYATIQLKRDTLLDNDELRPVCFKRVPEVRSAEDFWDALRKQANKLSQGKLTNCNELDDSPELKEVIRLSTKRLTAIAKAKASQSGMAKASAVSTVSP